MWLRKIKHCQALVSLLCNENYNVRFILFRAFMSIKSEMLLKYFEKFPHKLELILIFLMFNVCMTWYNMFTFKKIYAHNYTHTQMREIVLLIKINNKSCNINVKLVLTCSRCLCSHWNNLTMEFIYTIKEKSARYILSWKKWVVKTWV